MEGLDNMHNIAKITGRIQGFEVSKVAGNSVDYTHLQYADDTLFFCGAEEEQLLIIRLILVYFEAISGLHINWNKSHLYPINVVPEMDHLSQIMGGAIGTLPSIYLGMPLGAEYRSIDIWNPILEKCEKKLTRWRSQYLSLGGRLTLINSVLDALPTYMLSIFHIPQSVVQRLDKIRRNFLWQGNKERKGFHLVKWKNIIRSKEQGRLGIKNLKYQSKALKVKWLWRYHQEDQALWYRVIKSKYEQLNTWVTKEVNTPYGISLWKSIRIFWQFLSNQLTVKV